MENILGSHSAGLEVVRADPIKYWRAWENHHYFRWEWARNEEFQHIQPMVAFYWTVFRCRLIVNCASLYPNVGPRSTPCKPRSAELIFFSSRPEIPSRYRNQFMSIENIAPKLSTTISILSWWWYISADLFLAEELFQARFSTDRWVCVPQHMHLFRAYWTLTFSESNPQPHSGNHLFLYIKHSPKQGFPEWVSTRFPNALGRPVFRLPIRSRSYFSISRSHLPGQSCTWKIGLSSRPSPKAISW